MTGQCEASPALSGARVPNLPRGLQKGREGSAAARVQACVPPAMHRPVAARAQHLPLLQGHPVPMKQSALEHTACRLELQLDVA